MVVVVAHAHSHNPRHVRRKGQVCGVDAEFENVGAALEEACAARAVNESCDARVMEEGCIAMIVEEGCIVKIENVIDRESCF